MFKKRSRAFGTRKLIIHLPMNSRCVRGHPTFATLPSPMHSLLFLYSHKYVSFIVVNFITACAMQDTAGSVFSLCNQLSQTHSGGCCVDVTNETFTLDSSNIPEALRVPESVQGIKFWPVPDDWLKAVNESSQHRNFYSNNFSDAYSLDLPSTSVTACTVPCHEFLLTGGTIILGEDGCMVLNGRGDNDMEMQQQSMNDVTINGAFQHPSMLQCMLPCSSCHAHAFSQRVHLGVACPSL